MPWLAAAPPARSYAARVSGRTQANYKVAVVDEESLVCFQRIVDGEVERDFAAVA
jgi:hypothetical protein